MSDLRCHSQDYLGVRRALGYKLTGEGRLLANFVAYADENGASTVTTSLAIAWTTKVAGSAAYLARRMRVARGFARYLHVLDPATEIPPADLFPAGKHRPVPYIFAGDDVVALMAAAKTLNPPLRAATFETLIGLLAATGMRGGETMALDVDDVDWPNRVLTVRNSKFGKFREILLHPSTVDALSAYDRQRERLAPRRCERSFFVSTRGTRLSHETIQPTFRQLLRTAGLHQPPWSPQPTLHGLRHSFAIDTLVGWYRDGGDVAARIPLLSTYLGHYSERAVIPSCFVGWLPALGFGIPCSG